VLIADLGKGRGVESRPYNPNNLDVHAGADNHRREITRPECP